MICREPRLSNPRLLTGGVILGADCLSRSRATSAGRDGFFAASGEGFLCATGEGFFCATGEGFFSAGLGAVDEAGAEPAAPCFAFRLEADRFRPPRRRGRFFAGGSCFDVGLVPFT